MATIDSLDIQITADAKKAGQGIDSLINKLDILSSKLRGANLASGNAFGNISSSTTKLSSMFGELQKTINSVTKSTNTSSSSINRYAFSFMSLYAKTKLAIRGFESLYKSIQSTSDYIETYNFYNVSFGKIANEWSKDWGKYGKNNAEDYAKSFTERLNADFEKMSGVKIEMFEDGNSLLASTGFKNLGLNIQEVTQYGAQLASVTNAVGQTGETSLAVAKTFTKLAGDVSSLFNVDYSNVADNIQSVLQGQSRAGYKYGWDTTLATLQQYADALDLSKAVSEMSQMEKQQLRILAILDQSRVAWGDLANTINSPSNMMRQFKNNVAEVGLVLGQLFIPILQKVMPVLNGATIALKSFLTSFASMIGIQLDLDSFGQGFAQIGEGTEDLSEGLDDVTSSANKALKALGKYDELNNVSSSSNNLYAVGSLKASIDLTDEIIKAATEFEEEWNAAYNKMQNKAQEVSNNISEVFKPISEPLTRFFQHLKLGGWTQAGEYAGKTVSAIFDSATEALNDVDWEKIGYNIGLFLKGIDWTKVISSVGNFLKTALGSATRLLAGSFNAEPIGTIIVSALGLARFSGLGGVLKNKITGAIPKGISVTQAIALTIPLDVFFQTRTTEGAEKYLESLNKFNSFDWSNMKNEDWLNILKEFGMATAGLSGKFYARQTQVADYFNSMPLRENYATLEEYNAALEEWQENQLNYFGEQKNVLDVLGEKMSTWAEENIAPWLSKKVWGEYTKDATSGIEEEWGETEIWWLKSINKIGEALSGLTGPALGLMGNGSYSVPQYATGGFPEDGLFMANRGELVGQFSNGRTAVANNEQIVSGIEGGVERAVTRVLAPYLVQIAQNTRETADKEFGITEKQIFDANRRQSQYYTKRTGKQAFG